MPERNNRRRKKLSYLLVYNLVVEIKKPYKQKTQKLDPKIIWSLHSVRCVPSEHRRGTGFDGCSMSQLKLQGGQSH